MKRNDTLHPESRERELYRINQLAKAIPVGILASGINRAYMAICFLGGWKRPKARSQKAPSRTRLALFLDHFALRLYTYICCTRG